MASKTMKSAGALASSMLLVSAAAAGAAGMTQTAFADEEARDQAAAVDAATGSTAETQGVESVAGQFSFTQDAVTANATIGGLFTKAAAALCSSMPQYALSCTCGAPLMVTGPDGTVMEATMEDLAADDGSTFVMGCACATNAPGGGAIANAEVSGAAIASVLAALS